MKLTVSVSKLEQNRDFGRMAAFQAPQLTAQFSARYN
jgi:hypothetical protein